MNPQEENLTNRWLKTLQEGRGYDIIIRGHNHKNVGEFDVIGVKFTIFPFECNPWIECIETTICKQGHEVATVNKIVDQTRRRLKIGAFNKLLVVCNSMNVLVHPRLQRCLGRYYAELPSQNIMPMSRRLQEGTTVFSFNYARRYSILNIIHQLYDKAKESGFPCYFVKCSFKECIRFHPWKTFIPPPVFESENEHSFFCPLSENHTNRMRIASEEIKFQGASYTGHRYGIPV